MKKSEEIIADIQKMIFEYNFKEFNQEISALVNKLGQTTQRMEKKHVQLLNEILKMINAAIKNKDFLLLADVLEYELKPLLSKYPDEPGGTANVFIQ